MWAWELLELTVTDRLFIAVRKRLTEIVLLLQCSLRAAELERRAAEEPLRSDIDIARLKVQILGRIEVLEARVQKKEEMLSELVPTLEERRQDTVALKAVVGRRVFD